MLKTRRENFIASVFAMLGATGGWAMGDWAVILIAWLLIVAYNFSNNGE